MRASLGLAAVLVAVCLFAASSADARERLAAPQALSFERRDAGILVRWRAVRHADAYRLQRCVIAHGACTGAVAVMRIRGGRTKRVRYVDRRTVPARTYGYRVRALGRDGRRGKASRLLTVKAAIAAWSPDRPLSQPQASGLLSGLPSAPIPLPTTTLTPTPTSAAAPGTANFWIDGTGGTCSRQSTAGGYRDAAACGSAQDAYAAASCGDVVRYRPGAGYGSLTIASGAKSCGASGRIVFAPEDDAPNTLARQSTVVIARIEIQVSDCWCEIRDIDTFSGATTGGTVEVDGGDGPPVSADVVLRRIDTRTFWLPARDVEIHGGSAGGFNACSDGDGGLQDAVQIWQSGNPAQPPGDILIDGIYIHDMGATATCDDHSDAIQMLCGTNITIRNSRFVNGPDEDIIGRPFRCPLENIVIENNMLGTTGGYQNITIGNGDVCSNIVIRNNSAAESVNLSCSAGGSGNRHYNNIASNCIIENAASSNNVHTGTVGCGTNARHCTPTYAHANHATTADQHLAANDTCAKDHGTPDAPKHDYDGDPRPPDNTTIGADEPESEAD